MKGIRSTPVIAICLAVPLMAQGRPPKILQIVREPLTPGGETAYKTIEDATARICAEQKCPHPHLAIESLSGPREVWWLNAFESEAEKQRVESAYAQNGPLMAALQRNSRRKAKVTGSHVNVSAEYRPDLSRGVPWAVAGARFLVVAVSREDVSGDGSVFEAGDGMRYMFRPCVSRQQADAEVARWGRDARVFAIRPYWGLPAKEWLEADPEFWRPNPLANRR